MLWGDAPHLCAPLSKILELPTIHPAWKRLKLRSYSQLLSDPKRILPQQDEAEYVSPALQVLPCISCKMRLKLGPYSQFLSAPKKILSLGPSSAFRAIDVLDTGSDFSNTRF